MKQKSLLRSMLLLFALIVGSSSVWAETATLSNANIYAAGNGGTGYATYNMTDGSGNLWSAYAIKNKHSNATSSYHFLQIKKYEKSTAYFIHVPTLGKKITSITMTVSNASQPMTGGGNSSTLYFSASNSTSEIGTGVASGTGASSVTIDCSNLNLNTGYITASGAVRIWDVTVTYTNEVETKVAKPSISPDGGTFIANKSVTITCPTTGATIYYTEDGTTPTSSSTLYEGEISVSSSKTIKAIAVKSGLDNSEIASADFTIIPSIPARNPKAYNSNYFVKVTDVNDLEDGDAILIVNKDGDKAMAGQNSTKDYRDVVAVSSSDGVISTVPTTAQKLVLIKTSGLFFFTTGEDSYLYASSSSSNDLKTGTGATAGENAMASIVITSGDATIAFKGENTNNNLRYNYNQGNPRFSCYSPSSTQALVNIYKEVPTATITLNAACTDGSLVYGTYSNSSAFVVPDNLIVSEITVLDGGTLWVESYKTGDVVPANTGVMVAAEVGGDYTVLLSSEDGESIFENDNMLKASGDAGITAAAMATAAPNCLYYRLTMHNGTQIGYWWGAEDGVAFELAANKAYLAVPKAQAPLMGFEFDDETTDIQNIERTVNDNQYYTLDGRRVAEPTKGLYIINGKKVVIK